MNTKVIRTTREDEFEKQPDLLDLSGTATVLHTLVYCVMSSQERVHCVMGCKGGLSVATVHFCQQSTSSFLALTEGALLAPYDQVNEKWQSHAQALGLNLLLLFFCLECWCCWEPCRIVNLRTHLWE